MGVFAMPSLGADMKSGTLVEWLKAPGDTVARGDIVAVVETEKGAIEVEIFEDGTIGRLLVETGEIVSVGTPLALVLGPGETLDDVSLADAAPRAHPEAEPDIVSERVSIPTATAVRASPAAREYARKHEIDLETVSGSGPSGAIQLRDVERPSPAPKTWGVDITAMRHAIAAAMARSKAEIPHYYLTHRADLSEALAWLDEYNANRPPPERLLLGVLLIKASALAIHDFPEFNGFWEDDGFRPSASVHPGIAIAIRGGGLVAPAIRDAGTLVLPELMQRMRDLIGRIRRGGFRASELSSPTVTINSLGERGVESVLPIIYPPQVAILGFGAITRQPWVVDDVVTARPVVSMTLAADHRASDGHRGALLLRAITDRLASPEAL